MQALASSAANQPSAEGTLVVSNVSKSFKSAVALAGVSFAVRPGELFGVVGPDGAGKSTLFNILAGIMPPTSGAVSISSPQGRPVIGYVTQRFSFSEDLSVRENINYALSLQGIDPRLASAKARAIELLQGADLERFEKRLAGQLSGGMRQKLALCCALVTKPQVLLLDEPSTGLDPIARRELWHLFVSIAHSGVATLVATPDFDEAELCQRVGFLDQGNLFKVDTPDNLRLGISVQRLVLQARKLDDVDRHLRSLQQTEPALLNVERFGNRLDLLISKNWDFTPLKILLSNAGFDDIVITPRKLTMENAYSLARPKAALAPIPEPPPSARMLKTSELAIDARGISRRFGNFLAVHDLSLRVERGEVFGLLGANGAGKTTTIRMLCGLTQPTQGTISVLGFDPSHSGKSLRSLIGYMNQQFSLYDDLSVQENIEYTARAYGLSGEALREGINWAITALDLETVRSLVTGRLSRGWRQRVSLAAAIAHQPQILLLDEPTAGTHPEARRRIWGLIRQLTHLGVTVLVTTHHLDEAQFCNKIGLLVDGTLIADGTPTEITDTTPGSALRVASDRLEDSFNALAQVVEPWRLVKLQGHLRVICLKGDGDASTVRQTLESTRIDATIEQSKLSLEEAFIVRVQQARGIIQ